MRNTILAILVISVLSGCADVSNVEQCLTVDPYGFWYGLWHGMTVPFSWIAALFFDDIAVYAVNNSGGWYDFGFILGIGTLSSSATSTVKNKIR